MRLKKKVKVFCYSFGPAQSVDSTFSDMHREKLLGKRCFWCSVFSLVKVFRGIIVTLSLSEQDRWHLKKKNKNSPNVLVTHWVFCNKINKIGVLTAIRARYTVYNDSQPAFLLYKDLFVYLQFSHLRLVWYWRPTKNNYPWCWRQAELNWKPWQHSACLSNPLALPESRQIPAQAPAYSTPA